MSVTIVEHGDIFALRPQPHAVVVPVNCVGVPGKGFALAAAKAWPKWARAYKAKCSDGGLLPGDIHVYNRARDERHWNGLGPSLIIAAAVKDHWRDPSLLPWVDMALHKLAEFAIPYRHGSGAFASTEFPVFALPAIGCGLGGLSWDDVRPMAEKILARALCVNWQVYAPHEAAKKGSKR